MKIRITLATLFSLVVLFSFGQGVKFSRDMAPAEGWVKAPEKPYREEICINGYWEFQPLKVPGNWKRDLGVPPELTIPEDSKWEKVKIKIPSPWNANSILHDKTGGGMDSRTYPSYPESWNSAKMGWLRKKVTIPESWKGKTISLRLQAVAGDCRIMVNNKEIAQQFENALPNEYDITEAIEWGKENEILLGIRDAKLNNLKGKYGSITYPTGSFWLMDAIGVWQDVFVLAKPNVHITDIFFQPQVKQDVLLVDVELVNNSGKKQEVQVQLPIYEWINKTDLSKQNMLMAPEISWSLGEEAMKLSSVKVVLEPNQKKNITLKADVKGRLKKWELWTRGNPNLYAGVAQLQTGKNTIDKYYQRFGWRDIKIENGHVMLNGRREQLMHEGWHFTGIPTLTRRYVWAWYTIAKDAHVNLVRPHAMPYPSFFYDMADEMGMLLMDESGIFGSHVGFNYESDLFWERNQKHIESLVRRDRNHPSVMGWSVSNEVRCVLVWQAKNDPDFQQKIYDKIFDLTKIARSLDPTRDWVQSDGDKDLDGRLGVYTIHTGGAYSDVIPKNKPWGVTEGGSSYYGKAGYYEPFVGDRSYRSFNDRMDGLAIEDYNLIRTLRKDSADVLNVWNLVWHGLKPLPLGLKNPAAKVLKLTDGVLFEPYVEGKPGIQPERIAPYSLTVNPGYDSSLPLLNPYPLYTAMQSAMSPNGSLACKWDQRDKQMNEIKAPEINNPIDQVGFVGDKQARIYSNLKSIGVPVVESDKLNKFLIIDVTTIDEKSIEDVKKEADKVINNGGTVLLVGLNPEKAKIVNQILPTAVQCVPDKASSLIPNLNDQRAASISYKELYFAEDAVNKTICNYTLKGDFIDKGITLLFRNNTEWLRWITGGEYSKTISVYRSELENKQTPVLAEYKEGKGNYLVSTIELEGISASHVNMYIKLFKNIGLKLNAKQDLTVSAFSGKVLVRALSLGRFGSDDLATTLSTKYIPEETVKPKQNTKEAGMPWKMVTNVGDDLFIFKKMAQAGPETVFATYFSYWVFSPVDLSDLLNSGPDLPQVTLQIIVNSDAKVLMNGRPLKVTKADKDDSRKRITYNSIPLRQGWNQFLIKAVSDSFAQPNQGSIRVTMESNNKTFDEQLKSAIEN
jgi:beta-galactosidase